MGRLLGVELPSTGIMDVQTRSAVRSLQTQAGLPVTGRIDADTRDMLLAQCRPGAEEPAGAPDEEPAAEPPQEPQQELAPALTRLVGGTRHDPYCNCKQCLAKVGVSTEADLEAEPETSSGRWYRRGGRIVLAGA